MCESLWLAAPCGLLSVAALLDRRVFSAEHDAVLIAPIDDFRGLHHPVVQQCASYHGRQSLSFPASSTGAGLHRLNREQRRAKIAHTLVRIQLYSLMRDCHRCNIVVMNGLRPSVLSPNKIWEPLGPAEPPLAPQAKLLRIPWREQRPLAKVTNVVRSRDGAQPSERGALWPATDLQNVSSDHAQFADRTVRSLAATQRRGITGCISVSAVPGGWRRPRPRWD